jgi:bacteriorhodopsin
MRLKELLFTTAYVSLYIQLLTGSLGSAGIFIELKPEDMILKDILILETVVQFIEFVFYGWLVSNLNNLPDNVTVLRYLDWNITTPIMLISTVMYMKYNTSKDKDEIVTAEKMIDEDKEIILRFVLYNFLMLFFGLLGELDIANKYVTFSLGFVFFYLSFKEIYDNYVGDNEINKGLFNFLFVVWSLYGIAALFNFEIKNISYNILDLFSKNFYGLFIFYIIYQTKMNY